MTVELPAAVRERAAVHRALGEPHRLAIVDALVLSDRSPTELRELTGLPSNLLAFHLDVLEDVGLVARRTSEGDGRRRYASLRPEVVAGLPPAAGMRAEQVLFVCTRNSARSPIAAALWRRRTGRPALSAGTAPAERVDARAVEVAAAHGLDLGGTTPTAYAAVAADPDLVVSVCDRARESRGSWRVPQLHWSVPDPVPGDRADFERAFRDLEARVDRLAGAVGQR